MGQNRAQRGYLSLVHDVWCLSWESQRLDTGSKACSSLGISVLSPCIFPAFVPVGSGLLGVCVVGGWGAGRESHEGFYDPASAA